MKRHTRTSLLCAGAGACVQLTTDSVVPLTLTHSNSRALNSFFFPSSFLHHSQLTLFRCCYARLFSWLIRSLTRSLRSFVRSCVRLMFTYVHLSLFFSLFNIRSLGIFPSLNSSVLFQFFFFVFVVFFFNSGGYQATCTKSTRQNINFKTNKKKFDEKEENTKQNNNNCIHTERRSNERVCVYAHIHM